MIRTLLLAALLAPPFGAAQAQDAATDSVLMDRLSVWTLRARDDLLIEDGPQPSRTLMAAVDLESYQARAELGALVSESSQRARPGRVEVVVGDDLLNSSRFQLPRSGPPVVARPSFVIDDVPLALDRDLWLTADHAYKAAVVQYQLKQAAMAALGGEAPPADWAPAAPVQAVDTSPLPALDQDLLRRIAIEASARFRDVPGLRVGRVEVHGWGGHYHLATSDGTRLIQPEGWVAIYAQANLLRPDGVRITDQRQWLVRSTADLPPIQEILAEIDAMGASLAARAQAALVHDYEGPVVFEGAAAADLFRYLAPLELCGTPPEPSPDRSYRQLVRNGPRLGRRLLPDGWSITDDPARANADLPGSYRYDREGVPAERVELVRDGYVRDLLMSQVPRHDLQRSNGHARGPVQAAWEARLSQWEVTPPHNLGKGRFERRVARAMKDAKADRVLVVRDLGLGHPGDLPRPTNAVWRYADGREEPVVSLQFQRVDRRALRDILAAGGGQQQRAYLAPWTMRSHADGDSGLPTVISAPQRVLVGELEAVFPGPDEKPAAYPMPPLAP
jgi:TldD protein